MTEDKALSFLSTLKRAAAPPAAEGGATGFDPAAAARIESLEKRIEELTRSLAPKDEAPKPPSELMLFLQTRMELLEQKLKSAQEEALKANLRLREREEIQKEAQHEVEEMFRTMREQTRAASWDAKLREQFAEMRLRWIPAEEVLSLMTSEQGREELESRLKRKIEECPGATEPSGTPERSEALMLGRIADLERRLVETEKERDAEKARRLNWEKDILLAMSKEPQRFKRSGGAELVVEAALEGMVATLKRRDEAAAEAEGLLKRISELPQGDPDLDTLRLSLNEARGRLEAHQAALDKNMALVQAWLKGDKGR